MNPRAPSAVKGGYGSTDRRTYASQSMEASPSDMSPPIQASRTRLFIRINASLRGREQHDQLGLHVRKLGRDVGREIARAAHRFPRRSRLAEAEILVGQ